MSLQVTLLGRPFSSVSSGRSSYGHRADSCDCMLRAAADDLCATPAGSSLIQPRRLSSDRPSPMVRMGCRQPPGRTGTDPAGPSSPWPLGSTGSPAHNRPGRPGDGCRISFWTLVLMPWLTSVARRGQSLAEPELEWGESRCVYQIQPIGICTGRGGDSRVVRPRRASSGASGIAQSCCHPNSE